MTRLCVLCWLLAVVCCWGLPSGPTRRPVLLARPYRRQWAALAIVGGLAVGLRVEVALARR